MDDIVNLGGVVELSGFGQVEKINNVVINKIVGSYARKYKDLSSDFEKLQLHLKTINNKFELHGKIIDGGKIHTSEVVDRNLYFALDACLKKMKAKIER